MFLQCLQKNPKPNHLGAKPYDEESLRKSYETKLWAQQPEDICGPSFCLLSGVRVQHKGAEEKNRLKTLW